MSVTWSTADLGVLVPGDPPVHLRYFDTRPGRTTEETYTTVIAIHGTGFNADIWKPWLPYVRSDIRVLAFNRRGYDGSSEPHQSHTALPGNTEAFGRYVVDLLGFIKYVAEELGLPSKNVLSQTGGIVLLGWSKGCATMIALLSLLPTLTKMAIPPYGLPIASLASYSAILSSHLRSVILFEPPQMIVGLPGPAEYKELRGVPPEELSTVFAEMLLGTVPEDKLSIVKSAADAQSASKHDIGCWNGTDSEERAAVATAAFKEIPATIGVGTLHCTTIDGCINGAIWITARCVDQPNATSRVIAGGNHFVMATDPEAFNTAVCDVIGVLGVH